MSKFSDSVVVLLHALEGTNYRCIGSGQDNVTVVIPASKQSGKKSQKEEQIKITVSKNGVIVMLFPKSVKKIMKNEGVSFNDYAPKSKAGDKKRETTGKYQQKRYGVGDRDEFPRDLAVIIFALKIEA